MKIRGLPFIIRDLATLLLQSANWRLYRKAWHFLRLYVRRTFWHTSAISIVYSNLKDSYLAQKMEFNREHFRAIIFYNFRSSIKDQCLSMVW